MRKLIMVGAFAAMALGGCEEQKSVEYYKAHKEEAMDKFGRCHANGDAGEGCGNAAVALKELSHEEFERGRAETIKAAKDGSYMPTWNGK